jgi:hypothetical protein
VLKKAIDALGKQDEIGARTIEAINATNDALLKAAAKTPQSSINGTHLTREEAELLRTTPRRKLETRFAVQRMRVLGINTSDPKELSILISTPDKRVQYRIKFVDDHLFAGPGREAIFKALDSREPIWMELRPREAGGEVHSVEFVRTRQPPQFSDLEGSEE